MVVGAAACSGRPATSAKESTNDKKRVERCDKSSSMVWMQEWLILQIYPVWKRRSIKSCKGALMAQSKSKTPLTRNLIGIVLTLTGVAAGLLCATALSSPPLLPLVSLLLF